MFYINYSNLGHYPTGHVGSQFLNQASSPRPLKWKRTTREAPKSVSQGGMTWEFGTDIHILLCMCAYVLSLQSCLTLCDPMNCSLPGSICPWDSLRKNNGVGSHALLHGIKPTCLMSPELAGKFFATSATWEAHCYK